MLSSTNSQKTFKYTTLKTVNCIQAYLFGIPSLRLTCEQIENRLCICLMNAGGTVVVTGGVVGNPCFTAIFFFFNLLDEVINYNHYQGKPVLFDRILLTLKRAA